MAHTQVQICERQSDVQVALLLHQVEAHLKTQTKAIVKAHQTDTIHPRNNSHFKRKENNILHEKYFGFIPDITNLRFWNYGRQFRWLYKLHT